MDGWLPRSSHKLLNSFGLRLLFSKMPQIINFGRIQIPNNIRIFQTNMNITWSIKNYSNIICGNIRIIGQNYSYNSYWILGKNKGKWIYFYIKLQHQHFQYHLWHFYQFSVIVIFNTMYKKIEFSWVTLAFEDINETYLM